MTGKWQNLKGALLAFGVLAVAMATAQPAMAQTPEGTVIRNIATVTFTDANNNAYDAVADTVDVTVGFAAALDVTGALAVTPASPSTGNVLTFTIGNIGNGTDSVSVGETISVAGVITVTGYQINGVGTVYASLAALNTALSAVAVAQGGSITVDVIYDVLAGQGGSTTNYTLTGTSRRDGAVSDAATTAINPTQAFGVAVTPDGGQLLQHLPTNAAPAYQFTFAVQNTGNGTQDFNLTASSPGSAVITIVSVNGTAGTTSTIAALAAGASQNVIVEYTIASVAAGSTDTLYLAASPAGDPGTTDDGFADVTVIRPALAIAKEAWLGDRSAQIAGDVLPGDFIEYRVEVTNTGTAPAASVVVTDLLQVADVTFVSTENTGGAWSSINFASPTVTATLNGALAPAASAQFWIRVQVN
jgi:uncharacterized repeat protein (TIGR01451 family)